jgi:hypothetical protein
MTGFDTIIELTKKESREAIEQFKNESQKTL